MKYILGIILGMLLSAGTAFAAGGLIFIERSTGGSEVVSKYLDTDTNVVCYIVEQSGSISCLPQAPTTPEKTVSFFQRGRL